MLLTMLALLSSTTILVGSVLAANFNNVGFGGYSLAIAIGLLLAASNLWIVHRSGFLLADLTRAKSDRRQDSFGKAFAAALLLWAVCAEFLGYWVSSIALRLDLLR